MASRRTSPLLVLAATLFLATNVARADDVPKPADAAAPSSPIDGGDTAWMLVSSGLVMLMVPGLAFFYGGIVRRKNVLGTMMHSIVALSIVGVLWVVVGYALAFGTSTAGFIGWDPRLLGLKGVLSSDPFPNTKIPIFVHCMYQGMFAIITPALISGAVAERVRFGPYCLFIALWSLVVYCPLAHWVWAVDAKGAAAGWLGQFGALDFAGGTVVHIAAGFSGLAAIMVLRKRIGYPEHAMHPNSMVLTLFGAGLLWFGWFGFNGGSALGSNGLSGAALSATQVAAASAGLAWTLIEWFHRGKPTALGLATGIVAGLVAVTPASGYVTPLSALLIGIVASAVCYGMVFLKPLLKYDDSLDAFGVHGIGGLVGALLTGVLASMKLWQSGGGSGELGALGSAGDDILAQMKSQCLAAGVAMVFSFVVTIVLVKGIDLVFGFCLISEDEAMGLDYSAHGEVGFDFGLTGEMEVPMPEPRAAMVPPNGGRRFSVVVDGADDKSLMDVWSDLCQTSTSPPPSEFKAVYPYVTTVQGNRFRFRGGDPSLVSANLERLFQSRLDGKKIRTHLDV